MNNALTATVVVSEQVNGIIECRFPVLTLDICMRDMTEVCQLITSCGILHDTGLIKNDIFPFDRRVVDDDMLQVVNDGPNSGKSHREILAHTHFG